MLRMALEAAQFDIFKTTYDKDKGNQKLLFPIYLIIKLITKLLGEKRNKRYWLSHSNHKDILMGGNSLIVISKKT